MDMYMFIERKRQRKCVCMYACVHECVLGGGAYANVRLCLCMRVSARVEVGNGCVYMCMFVGVLVCV